MCFFKTRQGETESNDLYLKFFKSSVQNLELVGGSNFLYSVEHIEERGEALADSDKKISKEQFLAMCFLKRSDQKRYCHVLDQVQQRAYLGRDKYPKMIVSVYDTLIRFLVQFKSVRCPNQPRNQAMTDVIFLQTGVGDIVPGNDGVTQEDIECYNCRKRGHLSGN